MLLGNRLPTAVQDGALLIARVVLGVVLIAHGWQKFEDFGINGVAGGFEQMGIPVPKAAALFAATVELGGGVLLLLGLLMPLVGVLVALDMIGAFWFAHKGHGVFTAEGGWELVAIIGVSALALAAVGAGRVSIDELIGRRLLR